MKELIEKLIAERTELYTRIDAISSAIKAFKCVCTHKHEDGTSASIYDCRDSHREYYKCEICGKDF